MSYVAPLGNAVHFTATGAVYIAPLGNAVNFRLPPVIPQASGFCGTQLGTPALRFAAESFAQTQFGIPTLLSGQVLDATGFYSSAFGAPNGVSTFAGQPFSIQTTTFGTPAYSGELFGQVTPADPATRFGQPMQRTTLLASGIDAGAAFGEPRRAAEHVGAGFISVTLGQPRARLGLRAAPVSSSVSFGNATTRVGYPATGFKVDTLFGEARPHRSYPANGWMTSVFGAPVARRKDVYSDRYLPCLTVYRPVQGVVVRQRAFSATVFEP